MDGEGGGGDVLGLFGGETAAKRGVVADFHQDRIGDSIDDGRCFLLLRSEEGIEEFAGADVLSELAMLEEDVHGLPKRVIEDFD